MRGIHQSLVNSSHKGLWHGALMFSFICVSINAWVNNHEAGDSRHHRTHFDVIVMYLWLCTSCGNYTQIARFVEPTWAPSGSCRPQMGLMLAPWTLLSGQCFSNGVCIVNIIEKSDKYYKQPLCTYSTVPTALLSCYLCRYLCVLSIHDLTCGSPPQVHCPMWWGTMQCVMGYLSLWLNGSLCINVPWKVITHFQHENATLLEEHLWCL